MCYIQFSMVFGSHKCDSENTTEKVEITDFLVMQKKSDLETVSSRTPSLTYIFE